MELSSLIVPVQALYAGIKAERDRLLKQAVQTKLEEMNRRGLLNSSMSSAAVTDLFIGELQPRADLLRSCVMKIVGVARTPPSDTELTQILDAAESMLGQDFVELQNLLASRPLSVDREESVRRLTENFDVPRRQFVVHLAADITAARNATTKPSKTLSDYKLALFSAAAVAFFGLIGLVLQKNYFEARERRLEKHYAAQQEIRHDLLPKLEALRLPLAEVTRASDAASTREYETALRSAIDESDSALDSLGSGYDLLRTRLRLEFDSTIVLGLDSIATEAQSVREGLQKSLRDSRTGSKDRGANNPGDNLEAADRLNSRISRLEERLLIHN